METKTDNASPSASSSAVKAVDVTEPNTTVTLKGSFDSWGSGLPMAWNAADQKYEVSYTFKAGDEFKVVYDGNWYGGYNKLSTYGWNLFDGNDNYKCRIGGTYTIGITTNKTIDAWFTTTDKVYVEYSTMTNAYVYNSGSTDPVSWPGNTLKTVSDPYYRGSSKATVKYVEVDSTWNYNLIFNDGNSGEGHQSNTVTLSPGQVYVAKNGSLGNLVTSEPCTNALNFVSYWRTLRKDGSICEYFNDPTKRAALISKYDEIGNDAKALVDPVSDYDDVYGKHTIGSTMAAIKASSDTNSSTNIITKDVENSMIVTVSIALLVAVILLNTSFIVLKLKKRQE